MRILAMDASGPTASVCVLEGGQVAYSHLLNQGLTHSQTLLALVDEALCSTGLHLGDLDRLAVTGGPGSFTGLRIAMALAKGLCQPYATPLVAVSTLQALATAYRGEGSVVASLNARRNEVYWAAFLKQDAGIQRISADAAAPVTALAQTLEGLPGPIALIGDGAELCYTEYKDRLPVQAPAPPPLIALGAAFCAAVAPAQTASAARPEYLRLSQAERERKQRLEKQ